MPKQNEQRGSGRYELRAKPNNSLEEAWTPRDRIGKVRIALTCRHRWLASGSLSAINRRRRAACDGITVVHQFSTGLRAIGVATTNLHAGC